VPRRSATFPSETALRLVADVAGPGAPPALSRELTTWVGGSSRMRAFVDANRSKIRRKLREARDADAQRDVRAELLAAARLLGDRRLELAYEAAGTGRGGPDFAVTFRSVTRFNVEVTRRRGPGDAAAVGDAVLGKLRQLPPSIPNVVVVAVDRPVAADEVRAAVITLRAHADARDPATLGRAGAADPKTFYDRFLRLAAIVAWAEEAPATGERSAAWINPSARIPLDRAAVAAIAAALAG
jgi:hypothetical protein